MSSFDQLMDNQPRALPQIPLAMTVNIAHFFLLAHIRHRLAYLAALRLVRLYQGKSFFIISPHDLIFSLKHHQKILQAAKYSKYWGSALSTVS